MSIEFEVGQVSEKFRNILANIKQDFNGNGKLGECLNKLEDIEKNDSIRVCFIGQYSAGKSTMISALTGNNSIKIDADIATDTTTDYKWNDITLTDTPGLFTDRPDHDETTLAKIREADLLVYCLTSDLFDDIILERFKDIAFKQKYANKLMFVINKMNDECGEYQELVDNYKETLNNSLSPTKINDFKNSFISSEWYRDGKTENDDDLINESHFEDFIKNLNDFVKEKGIAGKLDTPIRLVITTIDDLIIEIGSHEDKELFIALDRIEYAVKKSSEKCESRVKAQVKGLVHSIIEKSNSLTSMIGTTEINLDDESKRISNEVQIKIDDVRDDIQELIESHTDDLKNDIEDVLESDICKYVFESINDNSIKLDETSKNDFSKVLGNFEKVKTGTSAVTKTIGQLTGTTTGGLAKASQVAGSQGHEIVLTVGKFFGTKFKPWQAVNLAKNVANAAKFLGPVLSVVGLVLDVVDVVKDEEDAKKIAEAKRNCYNQFLKISDNVENQFLDNYKEFKKASYISILDQIKELRSSIIDSRNISSDNVDKLKLHRIDLDNLLNLIHK